ncbi:MAG TPA: universal stress protein [Verrucomicrobiae bacterium]|nr:universal stress protein [Verrucomicrobiae bacterium]
MIRTVLVASDGSEVAQAAVCTAIELTQSFGPDARLHVVAVVSYLDVPGMLAKHPAGAPDLLGEQATTALDDASALAAASGVAYETHRLEGDAVESILACAEETGAQILVIGAHGRSRLVRLVLGSIAERLVRSTQLPVVVVRR